MKLVFAVVQDEDGHKVMDELNKNGFSITRLSSSGGFLKSGNITLFTGVDDSKVDEVIGIIKKKSRSRRQVLNSSISPNNMGSMLMPFPVEVVVGGATIFVTNVERYERL